MKRHVKSFVKGAQGGAFMDGELVPTPADVMAKATKMLRRVVVLQLVWFLCFASGCVLMVWTAWKNTHLPALCTLAVTIGRSEPVKCAHHSYLLPVILLAGGIVGLLVTGYVATRLAVKYLGAGAMAFLRGGRRFMGPTSPPAGGQDMGGLPGRAGGLPPGGG